MQAFWKDACDEGGLAWDDTNNNRAFLAGEIAATLNGASIYIAAKRGQDKIKDEKGEPMVRDIQHARLPAGPAGSPDYHLAFSHAVMKYSKNSEAAKDFLKCLHWKEQFGKWFEIAEGFTWASTSSGRSTPVEHDRRADEALPATAAAAHDRLRGAADAKATEVYSKYVITDMFAKAVQGMKAEDAVKWAEGELKKIYG